MRSKSKQTVTVILSILLGAFLTGFSSAIVWYHLGYRITSAGSGWFTRDFNAMIDAGIGLVLGAIGGAIIGWLITGFRLGVVASIFVGLIVNGLFPWFVLFILDETDSNPPNAVVRLWSYASIGLAMVGGVVGLLIAIFNNHRKTNPSEDLP